MPISFSVISAAVRAHPYGFAMAVVATWFILKKIRYYSQSAHSDSLLRVQKKEGFHLVPDAKLFPQYLVNSQGLWLYIRRWKIANPKGMVFVCHGLGEHINRYEHVARFFNDLGFSVFGVDHQGHGLSMGDRAHVERFADYSTDYLQFVQRIRDEEADCKGMPCFLFGHSMGGAISILTCLEQGCPDWKGVILSAPAVKANPEVATPFKMKMARFLSSLVPKLGIEELDPEGVSRDRQVVEHYRRDPSIYQGKVRIRWGAEFLWATETILNRAPEFRYNVLVLQGEDDKLTIPEGAKEFFNKCGTDPLRKTLKLYPKLYHELLNEPEKDMIFRDIKEWVESL